MKALIVLSLVFLPIAASSQTVIDAKTVEFMASPDHAAVSVVTNSPIVAKYQLNCAGTGGTPLTKDLGKPTPTATGFIGPITVAEFLTITVDVLYSCTVTASGPGGVGVSAPSNFFGRSGPPRAPVAPTNVVVKP